MMKTYKTTSSKHAYLSQAKSSAESIKALAFYLIETALDTANRNKIDCTDKLSYLAQYSNFCSIGVPKVQAYS